MTMSTIALVSEGGGFNPLDLSGGGGLFWTIIIFVAALVPIWKMVMGPITAALEARDDRANAAIVAAERASSEAQKAQAEVAKKLEEARAESLKLVNEARARAEVRERELIGAAEARAKELEESARRTIQAEREKAVAAIREEVVDLTIQAAGRVIGRNVGSEDDRRMVRDMVGQRK
ncbi:MAG: F0F1 ATP synthase subunit B [Planctomycetes bacterium]|nr:F0F1 ATP synthase subunit B [Planctomycetota bacterium]